MKEVIEKVEFLKLPKLVDVRSQLAKNGSYIDYGIESKTDIAIHHSLTKVGDAFAFARYHVSLGWMGIGYHFVILKDGTVQWCNDLGVKSYHVGNSNRFALGICLVGDFRSEEPTEEQKDFLFALHEALKKDLPNYKRTRGHNEFVGYSWKACPVFDYKAVINRVEEVAEVPKTKVKSEVVVKVLRKGDRGEDVSKLQQELKLLGFNCGKVDGIFGSLTEAALTKLQKAAMISVDGIFGKQSWNAINEMKSKQNNSVIVTKKPLLREGAKGEAVKELQKLLNKLNFKCGNVDGHFGSKTEDALVRFQKVYLPYEVDGIAGKNVWSKLLELAK
jgi:N-acetylmuramoyl-L-alanine amidase